jgi:hypothetical protein
MGRGCLSPTEAKHIELILSDVHECLCEGDELVTMQLQCNELYQVIRRLMNVTFKVTDKRTKVRLASLEYKVRQYMEMLQDDLAIDN